MIPSSIINSKEMGNTIFERKGVNGIVRMKTIDLEHVKQAFNYKPHIVNKYKLKQMFQTLISELNKKRESIINSIIQETGKTKELAIGEFESGLKRISFIDYDIKELEPKFIDGFTFGMNRSAFVFKEPYGNALIISPFNYPFTTTLLMLIPAIVGGNNVIVKPSSLTPTPVYLLIKTMIEIGFKNIHLILGDSHKLHDMIKFADVIGFTGSTKTGYNIIKETPNAHHVMELGGNGAALICKDANLENTINALLKGCFKFSGQRCDAIRRIIIHKDIEKEFMNLFVETVKSLTLKEPLINQNGVEKYMYAIEDARKKGANVLLEPKINGNYVSPVILTNTNKEMFIYSNEVFAPIVQIFSAKSEEEMINLANNQPYGLDSSIFTNDINKALQMSMLLQDGEITINNVPSHNISAFPFGGNKKSGKGRIGIGFSVNEFTKIKTIVF